MGYRYFNGERWIGGTAAVLHQIKLDGGLESHYQKVVSKAINDFIEDANFINSQFTVVK